MPQISNASSRLIEPMLCMAKLLPSAFASPWCWASLGVDLVPPALAGQRFALSFLDKLLEPAQHLYRFPTRGVEHGIGQALIANYI